MWPSGDLEQINLEQRAKEEKMGARDADIHNDIVNHLQMDNRLEKSDVEIRVEDGLVTLTGYASNGLARNAAEIDAWKVPGVKKVRNDLKIVYPPEVTILPDEELRNHIDMLLKMNAGIDTDLLGVKVKEGIVTLEGTVDSFWKKMRAEEIVLESSGVMDLINKIAVVPTKDFRDEQIAEDIVQALGKDLTVDPDKIDVTVEDGVVTITGYVFSGPMMVSVLNTVKYTAGVRDIINLLEVE
jgi:osmotically-inducible protein OsmY